MATEDNGSIIWSDVTSENAERILIFFQQVTIKNITSYAPGEYPDFTILLPSTGILVSRQDLTAPKLAGFPPQRLVNRKSGKSIFVHAGVLIPTKNIVEIQNSGNEGNFYSSMNLQTP